MRLLVGLGCLLALACRVQAETVTFFIDRNAYDLAVASQSVITFEGIAPAGGVVLSSGSSIAVGGVTFTNSASGNGLGVADANATTVLGHPFESAVLFQNTNEGSSTVTASLPGGYTAVGADFGSQFPAFPPATETLQLYGTGGLLDTETVGATYLGASQVPSFYGWVVSGDTIVSVVQTPLTQGENAAIDNFSVGVAAPLPSPALGILVLLGGMGVWPAVRRLRRGAGARTDR